LIQPQRIEALHPDAAQLYDAEKSLRFLRAMVDCAQDAIISNDLNGIVMSWNPGAQRIFGYKGSEMVGKPISLLSPKDHPEEQPFILRRIRSGERIEHYETKRLRRDGAIIDISQTVSPIKNKLGKVIGVSTIARDVSEQKRMEAHQHRMSEEFLAVLSHELRTPLQAILGWTGILGSRKNDGMIQHAVEVIQRNAEVQKRLIEDLLDISRILTGKMVVKSGSADLPSILNAAIESVRDAAGEKGIALEFHLDDSVRYIAGDADRLQQVVWNLLSNAIKFTPRGGRVELRLRSIGREVEISVRDTGVGIPAGFLPHIFERFRQGDASTSCKHTGIGVGLAVVRHLVEAHGGTVEANSDGEGQGATFVVRLPGLKEIA
jgi:PAS domain S-box-containing protein